MSVQFANAPLIELIAELRWHTANSQAFDIAEVGDQLSFGADSLERVEAFLGRFAEEVEALGYRSSERLVPQNSAVPPGQAIVRFRESSKSSLLIQAGWGVVTVNAVRPYKNWEEFAPKLSEVIDALLRARDEIEQTVPFHSVSVRYVDAFTQEYWGTQSPSEFGMATLKFGISLPPALEQFRVTEVAPQTTIQAAFPLINGMRARVATGEGGVDGTPAVLMDIMVTKVEPTNPVLADLMDLADEAHGIIHKMFVGATQDIHPFMKGEE